MANALPGSSSSFFFRQDEVAHLIGRLSYPGITVVAGRPQSGKSY